MEILASTKVLNRFTKDFNLPINVTAPEHFEYFLNLYDEFFDSLKYFKMFTNLYEEVGNDNENFFKENFKVIDNAIATVKQNNAYTEFIADTTNLFNKKNDWVFNVPNNTLYKCTSVGKNFLSIDLVKGNYAALKYYSQEIKKEDDSKDNLILGSHNFEEFISNFTDNDYFKKSKHFRQVVFGNMNPKRQITIEKHMINEIAKKILENGIFEKEDIFSYNNDEIVFELKNDFSKEEEIQKIADELNIEIRIKKFHLKQLNPLHSFIKIYDDDSFEFKCVDSTLMPQVIKHVTNKEVEKEDLLFTATNGMLAYFAEPVKFEQ